MSALEEFASAERRHRERSCSVCKLPDKLRQQIDSARRSFDERGPGTYHHEGHVSVPTMVRFIRSEGHTMTKGGLAHHFDREHHRQ